MKAGKLSQSVLKRSVFKQLHKRRDEVISGAGIGMDAAVLSFAKDEMTVVSCDPVTLASSDFGTHGIFLALNDVASMGAEPVGILVNLLVPTIWNEASLRELMKEIDSVCESVNVEVVGGHTEVSKAIKEPLLTIFAVGKVKEGQQVSSKGVKPGMDILVTKWVGLEGTAILAKEREEALRSRYAQPFIDEAKTFLQYLSIIPEAAVAIKSGACAMHDVSEGGIFGALWDMAESAGVGLEIDLKRIPIRQETVEICEFFDRNPYKLLSGGSLLIATKDGNAMVRELEKNGIAATIIGKATDSNDRVLINEDERRFLETTQTDELYGLD